MRRSGELLPLRVATLNGPAAAEARNLARVARAWHFIVGPALIPHTRVLRIHRQTLVMGCWTTEVMSNLRLSAQATWPQVQARIERLLGLKLRQLEIVPCDPPPERTPRLPAEDPLEAVLKKLRTLRKSDWTCVRK